MEKSYERFELTPHTAILVLNPDFSFPEIKEKIDRLQNLLKKMYDEELEEELEDELEDEIQAIVNELEDDRMCDCTCDCIALDREYTITCDLGIELVYLVPSEIKFEIAEKLCDYFGISREYGRENQYNGGEGIFLHFSRGYTFEKR